MKVLHIDLKPVGENYAEFRYFGDNQNEYQSRQLPLDQIAGLINRAETDYYTSQPKEYAQIGQALYNWLDGSDRYLAQALNQHRREKIVLAISASGRLAQLPWEILHDGTRFLVEATPTIIPIRWVHKSSSEPLIQEDKPANRALNVLFMATSPLGVEPVLDYEAEEGQILAATQRTPIYLQVEESGCLSELGYLVRAYREYEKNYFDIFHLTGHATYNQKPYFLTEDEYGNQLYSDTSAIINALKSSIPPLIFLSGCRTGYASNPVVASMAEELLNLGATAVLGWGETVRDTDATAAASPLYWELSQGGTVLEALASTYHTLIQQQARDWHKLRLYVANVLPGALVTPLRTRGRKQLPKPTMSLEFRDDEKRLRVISRENFVGRRRQLQNCLRILKTDQEKVGVLLHGMGGLGKSSIAYRLSDRLPDFEKILWKQQIDEADLIRKLRDKLIDPLQMSLIPYLENSQVPLKSRLKYLFSQLAEMAERPFLFIFNDFEWNLEPREGSYILKSEVAPILGALTSAILETGTQHRLIITCRYSFDSMLLKFFYEQNLEPLRKAELTKKLNRLDGFNPQKISEEMRKRALVLADGNPLLLEQLYSILINSDLDEENILVAMDTKEQEFLTTINVRELLSQQSDSFRQLLGLAIIYTIPVPKAAFEVICPTKIPLDICLERGRALGLIEVYDSQISESYYRVPQLLGKILSIPENQEDLAHTAVNFLDQLWWESDYQYSEEQALEIHRLALLGKEENIAAKVCTLLSDKYNRRGRFRQTVSLSKNTLGIISNKQNKMAILINLANAYEGLGSYQEAFDSRQEAKSLAEELGNPEIEATSIGNLGIHYYIKGKIELSIRCYVKALQIASRLNNENLQGYYHNYLGISYSTLGDIEQAEYHYKQALAIAEKTENSLIEAMSCCNLCDFYGKIGDSENAITFGKRAIRILEPMEALEGKATTLHGLAEVFIDEERYDEAISCTEQGIEITKQIDNPKLYSENYSACACAYLYSNKLNEAWNAALEASKYDYPQNNYYVFLLLGLIALSQGNQEIADIQFQATISNLETLTSEKQSSFRAWDTKFIALCGLSVSKKIDYQNYLSGATEAYRMARLLNQSDGTVKRVRQLFKILKTIDSENRLNALQILIDTGY